MNKDWRTDTALYNHLVVSEEKRLKPYKCKKGFLTIGIGRNLDANGISDLEAELMCLNDINKTQNELDAHLSWWRKCPENVQFVMMDMCFNLGITKFKKFTRTLDLVYAGLYERASLEMLNSSWSGQVGVRAEKLSLIMRGK